LTRNLHKINNKCYLSKEQIKKNQGDIMTTELFNGAEMVVKSLSALKVKYIFGYPGGSVLDILMLFFSKMKLSIF